MTPGERTNTKKSDKEGDVEITQPCFTCNQIECYVTTTRGLKQKITNPSWVYCDLCKKWCHAMCQDMGEKDVTNLRKLKDKPGVKWFCNSCNIEIDTALKGGGDDKLASVSSNSTMKGKLDSIEEMVMKLTTAMSTSQSKLEERMQKLETSHEKAVASNSEGVKTAAQLNSDAKAQFEQILEQQQADHRKNNCIVYNIEPEAGKTTMERLLLLLDDSFSNLPKPLTAKRLKTNSNNPGTKPGPVKLEFADEDSKWAFVKHGHIKLKPKGIRIKLDESQAVRDQQYNLREQIRQMKARDGEESTTQYRIRNMKIQSKASGDWEFLQVERSARQKTSTM